MSARATKLLLPLLIFSLACGLVVPVSPPTPTLDSALETSTGEARVPTKTKIPSTSTPNILATQLKADAGTVTAIAAYTSTPSPSATVEIDPEDLIEEESLIPPPAVSPGESYRLENEILIDAYGIRYWRHTDSVTGTDDIILIEKTGMDSIKIESASGIVTLTDDDINDDGTPDIIVESYTGKNTHCCYGTEVYSLGEEAILILEKPKSNVSGEFEDITDDGIYEFITADDVFSKKYCPFVSSPFVKVIMAYDEKEASYLPASPNFPEEYIQIIEDDTYNAERVSRTSSKENGEWDETTKCSILPLMLDYIYTGDMEMARSELDRLYDFDDKEIFWNDVMLIVQESALYIGSDE